MEIISFVAIKGGVGKTTLTFNYGEWLSKKGFNVLMIDSDHQCSLTQTYDIYTTSGTIKEVFHNSNPEIIQIHENLSLIPSSMELDKTNNDIQTKANKELLFFMWLSDNYDSLKKFDYILIDCHPDFSTITQNMIAVSDFVFSPIEPSEYGFQAKQNLELRMDSLKKEVINVMTRESFINAKLAFIGNRVKHNTASSKKFVEIMKDDPATVALIPERETFNKATMLHKPIFELESKSLTQSEKNLIEEMNKIFESLTELTKEK